MAGDGGFRRRQLGLDDHLDGGIGAVVEPAVQRLDHHRHAESGLVGELCDRPMHPRRLGGLAAIEVRIDGSHQGGPAQFPPVPGGGDAMASGQAQRVWQRIGIGPGLVVVGGVRRGRIAVLHAGPRGDQTQQVQFAQAFLLGRGRDLGSGLGLDGCGEQDGGEAGDGGQASDVRHARVVAPPGAGKSLDCVRWPASGPGPRREHQSTLRRR